MRKQAKLVAVLSAAALLAVGASMTAFAATPHWDMQDGEWVYLDRNGDKVTDTWKKSNGQWYYLDSDGFMAKDQVIEGDDDVYYVGQDGARVANAWVSMDNDDLLDDDDEPESIDTVWMYFDASGKALGYGEANEVVKKVNYGDGQSGYFMFNNDGYMLSGWKTRPSGTSEDLYYLGDQNEGWARTGWHELEVNVDLTVFQGVDPDDDGETFWFYFKPNGKAYANTTQGYNGKTYVFDEVGRMLDLWTYKDTTGGGTGTYTNAASSADAGAAYYAEDNGGRDKNWIHAYPKTDYEEYDDDEYWFWLDSKGKPFKADATDGKADRQDDNDAAATDADTSAHVQGKVIKNNTYLFNENGVMLTGLFWLGTDTPGVADPLDPRYGSLDPVRKNYNWGNTFVPGFYLFDKTGYPSSNEGKMVTNKKVKIDYNGEDKIYYFSKTGKAYTNAVISSLVYDTNGQLVEDYGDGSTYEMVPITAVAKKNFTTNKWELTDKSGAVVVSGDSTDRVLINSYGRIKMSGNCKDIDGADVGVVKGIANYK